MRRLRSSVLRASFSRGLGKILANAAKCVAVLGFALAAHAATVPEPEGFWLGPSHGAVPSSLRGARVVTTRELARILKFKNKKPVLIDVSPAPRKPEHMVPGMVWMPPPHRDIPGSVWLPGMGEGVLSPEAEGAFRSKLAALTQNRLSRPLVIYCHPQCWQSWNAAKRAVLFGYRQVLWYPDGIEGWQAAGLPLQNAEPANFP
ncbi:MAG: rhodanese [Acidobacteriia bacterium]|nr:rhodanese [Methyloceanibacter sp.]MCL6491347.1 rhodanese [Terriglobia bacterium]